MSQPFNFKLSVLTASVLEVLWRVRSGEDISTPFVDHPEPDDE